jgi:predicted ArsR family transcriptional regulator
VEKLRAAPGGELPHSVLLKRMKMDSKSFGMLIETLIQQGDVEITQSAQSGHGGRPTLAYRLAKN